MVCAQAVLARRRKMQPVIAFRADRATVMRAGAGVARAENSMACAYSDASKPGGVAGLFSEVFNRRGFLGELRAEQRGDERRSRDIRSACSFSRSFAAGADDGRPGGLCRGEEILKFDGGRG